jgi:imidazolonepropionase-like amidohydrolase
MLGFLWLSCVDGGTDRDLGETGGVALDDLPPGALILDHARLVDATGVREGALVLDGEWIHSVVAAGQDWPETATVRDLEGRSVLPGLIDSHVHLSLSGASWWVAADVEESLKANLAWGVLGVVDVGGPFWTLELSERVSSGELVGPKVAATGPFLTVPGGHPCETVNDAERCWFVDGDAAERIQTLREAGAVAAKLAYAQVADWPAPRLDLSDVAAIAGAGLPAMAHVASAEDAADVHAAGVRLLAHVPFDSDLTVEQAALPFDAIHSTLSAFSSLDDVMRQGADLDDPAFAQVPEAVLEAWQFAQGHPENWGAAYLAANAVWLQTLQGNLVALREAGATVLAGSDAGYHFVAHGFGLHRELEGLVAAGWTNLEAIAAATLLPALQWGWSEHGLVAPDYRADLLVVGGRPDEEITATQAVHAILLDGEWHTRDSLALR